MNKYINENPCDTCGNRQRACCECRDYSCYSSANILEPTSASHERNFIVTESELKEMLVALMKETMNQRDGVDNWEWYGESGLEVIQDFYPEYMELEEIESNNIDFEKCAEAIIDAGKYPEQIDVVDLFCRSYEED